MESVFSDTNFTNIHKNKQRKYNCVATEIHLPQRRTHTHMQTVVETVTVLPLLISHQENPEYATIGVFGCIETLLHISIPLPVM